MIEIKPCTVTEIMARTDLTDKYAEESKAAGMPPYKLQQQTYLAMEKSGALTALGAYENNELVGFVVLLTMIVPHYSVKMTMTESIFVAKYKRNSGAGLKLIRAAEHHAKEHESYGLLITAPCEGQLADVLPKMGYSHSRSVFLKGLAHE